MNTEDLELWVFRPPVSVENRERFEKVFKFWHGIWRTANAEMIRPTEFPSDSFTRQSEIITLFLKGEPVALICHRHVDFEAGSTYHDSCFFPGTWRDEDKQAVRDLGGLGIMGSMITIHPDFRKSTSGLGTKYLITCLSFARAQALGVDTIVASIRTEKGLDRVFGGAGAHMIAPARPFFGAHVDLVAFRPRTNPIVLHPDYKDVVETLWQNANFSEPLEFKPVVSPTKLRRAA